jgi:hypothetical protein
MIEAPVLKTANDFDHAVLVWDAMTDVVGDDESHPLFPMMILLMESIGAWEKADPEVQTFLNSEGK